MATGRPPPDDAAISCRALYSNTGISFWGGVDPLSGNVIDATHPLHGTCIAGRALCVPGGRGSCTGSQVMLELILNGRAPRAVVTRDADSILCTGAIVAEEFFAGELDRRSVPVFCAVGDEAFARLVDCRGDWLTLEVTGEDDECVRIRCGDVDVVTRDLLRSRKSDVKNLELLDSNGVALNHILQEPSSPAEEMAMRTVRRVASISGARELIPITSGHIDAVTYIGPGGLRFAQRLVELGGKVKVPTTLNSQSCDRRRWNDLGTDASLAANANAVGDAYLELGCEMSFTCAPYLLPSRPKMGEQMIWGESNAVVYSNSVLGARTEKYADYFDICAAIVGYVPNVGVHVEENRAPSIVIDATRLIEDELLPNIAESEMLDDQYYKHGFDSFFPAMGWTCGNLSDGRIPLILGFDSLPAVSNDNLKAFCAAFGTTGSAPLFHLANVTPEAMGNDTLSEMLASCGERRVAVTKDDLLEAYTTLDSGNNAGDDVSLVALGNPHLSVEELGQLSALIECDDRPKHENVDVTATLGRHVQTKGIELGYITKLEKFGFEFITDTCWCMLMDPPIVPTNPDAKIITNSGKYAHYGPGLTNRRMRFGSMFDCIEAAKTGKLKSGSGNLPQWLRSFSSHCVMKSIRHIK